MKCLGLSMVACVALLFVACSQMVDVSDKFEPGTDFAKLKTYAWMEGASGSDIKPAGSLDLDVDTPLRKAVDKQMVAKGFKEVKENPDVLVKYFLGTRTTVYATDFGMHYQDQVGWDETSSLQDGQLTIDLMDSKSQIVVWRGSAFGALNTQPSQAIVNKNVDRAVAKIFKQYPPKTKS